MKVAEIREMLDYHYWAHANVWACVAGLTDTQFREELGYSVGSIFVQCVHTMLVERFWLDVVRNTLPDDRDQAYSRKPYTTRESIRAAWDQQKHDTYAYLDTCRDATLTETVTYDFDFCGRQSHERWKGLFYIVTHGVDHRAQILAGIHRLGGDTVAPDYITLVWSRKS